MKSQAAFLCGVAAGSALMAAGSGLATRTSSTCCTSVAISPAATIRQVEVTLHRFDRLPGSDAAFADWMRMLHRRHKEAVATLRRERTYLEAMFTARDEPRRLYWLTVQGAGGASVESSNLDLDHEHQRFMAHVLVKGSHARLTTTNVLAPSSILRAVREEQTREH